MVQAIGYQAIKAGYTVYYRSIFDLVRDFLHDEVLGQATRLLNKYLKPDLLIIDDMGMKQLPRRSGECLFEVVMRRYETRSTMMTSNRPLEDWGKLLGDAPGASAILDRFLHHAELVQMTGRSYRLRHQPAPSLDGVEDSKPANAPSGSAGKRPNSKPANAPPGPGAKWPVQNQPMRPPALEMPKLVASLQDFAGFVPATRDSLPPLDPASLIPVSLERGKRKPDCSRWIDGTGNCCKFVLR